MAEEEEPRAGRARSAAQPARNSATGRTHQANHTQRRERAHAAIQADRPATDRSRLGRRHTDHPATTPASTTHLPRTPPWALLSPRSAPIWPPVAHICTNLASFCPDQHLPSHLSPRSDPLRPPVDLIRTNMAFSCPDPDRSGLLKTRSAPIWLLLPKSAPIWPSVTMSTPILHYHHSQC